MSEARKYSIEVVHARDEAEIDALGDIHARAFADCFVNVFPMGPAMTEPYLNFRRSQIRRAMFASSNPSQLKQRGRYTTHLLKAVLRQEPESNGLQTTSGVPSSVAPGKNDGDTVGVVWYIVVPADSNSQAKEQLDAANAELPPFLFPEGYSQEAWDSMRKHMGDAESKLIDVNVIAVTDQARGKGVGAAMIDAIKEHAARLSSADGSPMPVHLDAVEAAVPFYKKQEFKIHDPLHDSSWGFRLFPALWSLQT